MKLQTLVERPALRPSIGYAHRLMLMGSCFAAHIGARLQETRFRCDVNPYGVLYNPLSISVALREMLAGKVYAEGDLYPHQGLWLAKPCSASTPAWPVPPPTCPRWTSCC